MTVSLCKLLFDEIESLTGIPTGLQMISCGSRMMHPSIPIHQFGIKNGKRLILSVKVLEEVDQILMKV